MELRNLHRNQCSMASLNVFGSPPGAGYPAEASVSIQWGTKLFQCCKDLDCIAYNP